MLLLFGLAAGALLGLRAAPFLPTPGAGVPGENGSLARKLLRQQAIPSSIAPRQHAGDRFGPPPDTTPLGLTAFGDGQPVQGGSNAPLFPRGDLVVVIAVHAGWTRAPPQA